MNEDKIEEQKIVSDGQMLADYIKSDGYKFLKARILDQVIRLSDITTIGDADPVIEIKSRKVAIKVILDSISEVEGTAKQHENHNEVLNRLKKEEYIVKY